MLPTRLLRINIYSKCLKNLRKYCSVSAKDKFVIKADYPPLVIPNITLHEFIWRNFEKWPDKTALICAETGRTLTFHEIKIRTDNLAQALRIKMGLNKGDIIATVMPNYPDYCITLLACIKAGIVVTTINPIYTKDEIKKQLSDSNAKLIVTTKVLYSEVKEGSLLAKKNIPIVTINITQNESKPAESINIDEFYNYNGPRVDLGRRNHEDLAMLPYSSGTTGLPKGVCLSEKNLLVNLMQMQYEKIRLNNETTGEHQDVIPVILPMYHCYALMIVFLNNFTQGCKLVLLPKYNPENFLKILDEFRPHLLHAAPPLVHFLSLNDGAKKSHLERMNFVLSAAAPLAAEDTERFLRKFNHGVKVLQGYGLTETSPLSHIQRKDIQPKSGGAGFVIPDTECKVVSLEEPYNDLPPLQSGEIYIRGPQVMKGYLNNPEATKNSIDENGWFKTGDIGHVDQEGQFFVTDRLKELIKVKGFQVAPAELEAVLRDHPNIMDAAVVGIKHPYLGEQPKAYVVPKPDSRLQPDQIVEYVSKKVAKYKHLTGGVEFIESVPRNPSGKILRRELKKY